MQIAALMSDQCLGRRPDIEQSLRELLQMVCGSRIVSNVVLMLGQRHRRWPNIKTTLLQTSLMVCGSRIVSENLDNLIQPACMGDNEQIGFLVCPISGLEI